MVDPSQSGCIHHPTKPAVARCKQCGNPVCKPCIVPGPMGRYCSEVCKQQHEQFMQKSQAIDGRERDGHRPIVWGPKIRKLVIVIGVIIGLGLLGSKVYVPVLSPLVAQIRQAIGI